eukprot:CAMPEP_0174895144 /NCGR_PEP_ID=MMETSP0167-20121228/9611_1 /TAXON_ID=38298 /ORGANISM="Rhodella maculata, Strain CCMP736" /LENGTH=459 /DNA_ID=CAMNT_0016134403 /DNA_START=44 /DNA_END=1423 /DNA_ORIENTATION=+
MSQLLFVGSFSANIDLSKALTTGFSKTEPSISATHGCGISIFAIDEDTGRLRSVSKIKCAPGCRAHHPAAPASSDPADPAPEPATPAIPKAISDSSDSCKPFSFSSKAIDEFIFEPGSPTTPKATQVVAGPNPSFLALHPSGTVIYSTNEVLEYDGRDAGAVSSFRLLPTGNLALINRVSSAGKIPCHVDVSPSGMFLAVANYSEGNFAVYSLGFDGSIADPPLAVIQHGPEGCGVDKLRQSIAHAHQCRFDPAGSGALYVPDLGLDKVMCYLVNEETGEVKATGELVCPPGSGPRHLEFHPTRKLVYIMCELDFSIVTAKVLEDGTLERIGLVKVLPEELEMVDGWMGSTVKVSPDGRFLYGGMRGPDRICICEIAEGDGTLSLVGHQKCGSMPRDFNLSPSGRILTVGSQVGNFIEVFKRDAETGLLSSSQKVLCGTPVCFKFGPAPRGFQHDMPEA